MFARSWELTDARSWQDLKTLARSWQDLYSSLKIWCLQELGNWQKQDLGKILANLDIVKIATNIEKILSCILHLHWCVQYLDNAQSRSQQDLGSIPYQFFQKFSKQSLQDPDKILGTCTLQDLGKILTRKEQDHSKILAKLYIN